MKQDPVIERVRNARRKISEAHDHDIEKLIAHYQDMQKKMKRKIFRKEISEHKVA